MYIISKPHDGSNELWDCTVDSKRHDRERIARDVEEFLKSNEIEKIPRGASGIDGSYSKFVSISAKEGQDEKECARGKYNQKLRETRETKIATAARMYHEIIREQPDLTRWDCAELISRRMTALGFKAAQSTIDGYLKERGISGDVLKRRGE